MSKLFDKFWDVARNDVRHFAPSCLAKDSWRACKAKAIELLKAEAQTNISDKKRSWEDVFRDL